MKITPHDIVAWGLLLFILIYLVGMMILHMRGHGIDNEAGTRSKEILIYIVGVLSGYIGLKQRKNGK